MPLTSKISAGIELASGYSKLQDPQSFKQLCDNQKIRNQAIILAKTDFEGMPVVDAQAVKIFWANQLLVLLNFIETNKEDLNSTLGIELPPQADKTKIIKTIDSFLDILENGTIKNQQYIVDLIAKENLRQHKTTKIDSQKKPVLHIAAKNSIDFLKTQLLEKQNIVIMDAANAQRPGAGGYEKGTFQEALTRTSNLYWLIPATEFRNVLNDTRAHVGFKVSEQETSVDVLSFQCRFLRLILHFTKMGVIDPRYFETNDFRQHFFNFANGIYGEMQNIVFELPFDNGFLNQCYFFNLDGIASTNDLFKENKLISTQGRVIESAFIVEVAAPDKRQPESIYDCSSAADSRRRDSRGNADLAESMIRNSISYTLDCAIEKNASKVILNAFGCGAFNNKPQEVARIFAEVLQKKARGLNGIEVYFLDLNAKSTQIFGALFSDKLSMDFDINPLDFGNCHANILLNSFAISNTPGDFCVVPTNNNLIKLSGLEANLAKNSLNEGAIIRVPNSDFEGKPHEFLTLKQSYDNIFTRIAQMAEANIIHFPLLGTGNLKYSVSESFTAFTLALNDAGKKYPKLAEKRIYLHILDAEKYQEVTHCLARKYKNDEIEQIERLYTLTLPDTQMQKNFSIGMLITNVKKKLMDNQAAWNEVAPGVYLSKIPNVREANEIVTHSKKRLRQVFSIVEDFELSGCGISLVSDKLQSPTEWQKMAVKHHQVIVRDLDDDFCKKSMIRALALALQTVREDGAIMIHCKAGKSRSATLAALVCFFLERQKNPEFADVCAVITEMKKHRPAIDLKNYHYSFIYEVIKEVDANPGLLNPQALYFENKPILAQQPLAQQIHAYLASPQAKIAIAQLCSFKEIKHFAILNPDMAGETRAFLKEIHNATDGHWLKKLGKDSGDFSKELFALIAVELGRNVEAIKKVVTEDIQLQNQVHRTDSEPRI